MNTLVYWKHKGNYMKHEPLLLKISLGKGSEGNRNVKLALYLVLQWNSLFVLCAWW